MRQELPLSDGKHSLCKVSFCTGTVWDNLSFATSVHPETGTEQRANDGELHPDCSVSGVTLNLHLDQQNHNLASATLSKTPSPFWYGEDSLYILHLKDKLILCRPQWLPLAPQCSCSFLTKHCPQPAHLSLACTAISASHAKLQQLQWPSQLRQSSKER